VAERLCPVVAEVRDWLMNLSPAGAMMSGSGTSLFALCRDADEALRVARVLRDRSNEETSPGVGGGLKLFIVRGCF
jgi:4-diphosphocytidyl-2C-methyl-D-erythritol kinase